jgi:hypothetical protein
VSLGVVCNYTFLSLRICNSIYHDYLSFEVLVNYSNYKLIRIKGWDYKFHLVLVLDGILHPKGAFFLVFVRQKNFQSKKRGEAPFLILL